MVNLEGNTPSTGAGLQAETAPAVSLDVSTGSGQSAIEAHEQTVALSRQYGLDSETAQQLGDILSSSSPEARANLADTLESNNLSAVEVQTLIESLHALRFDTRRSELNNSQAQQELLESTIERIADRYSGHQSDRRTCAVTSPQTRLAADPVSYVQMVEGLTSPAGTYQLESGATLRYIENSHLEDRALNGNDPIHSRSLETRIVQSALMQFAAGYETTASGELAMRYDPQQDIFIDSINNTSTCGVFPDWLQRMNNNLFNEGSTRLDTANIPGVDTAAEEVLGSVQESINQNGIDVTAEISTSSDPNDPHASHIVQITEIRDGRVYFYNGWNTFHQLDPSHRHEVTENGKIESMSIEDFQARLRSAYIPDTTITASQAQLTEVQASRLYTPGEPETYRAHVDPPADTYKMQELKTITTTQETTVRNTVEVVQDSDRGWGDARMPGKNRLELAGASAIRQLRKDDNEDSDLF